MVVKVGTSTLTHASGRLNIEQAGNIVAELAALADTGRQVVLVSSGAIGAGMGRLGLTEKPRTIPEQQAVAAVGQGLLMELYEKLFSRHSQVVAQVLLTREDLTDRRRFLNSRNTFAALLEYGVVPIVNENDTVAVDEIKFGDNDTLSAQVTSLVGADLLIMLSDVEGFYATNPQQDPAARLLEVVDDLTPELRQAAGGPGTGYGTGGMATKLDAARIVTTSGAAMVVADGQRADVLQQVVAGVPLGTFFAPRNRLGGRKRWIAFHQRPRGALRVDAGARKALLQDGKSLLPIGVVNVEGAFQEGDLVRVVDGSGAEFARGLVNYSAGELERIKGMRTAQIEGALGYKFYDEVIHRDNLAVSG